MYLQIHLLFLVVFLVTFLTKLSSLQIIDSIRNCPRQKLCSSGVVKWCDLVAKRIETAVYEK